MFTSIVRLMPASLRTFAWAAGFVLVASLTLGGFYRKLPSHLARLALILHALWNPTDPTVPLTGETMRRAIDLLDYYRVHIHRSLPLIGQRERLPTADASLAERILYYLARADDPDRWLGRSRLLVALGRPEQSAANDLIDGLVSKGVIETRVVRTGGRPATHYRLAQ